MGDQDKVIKELDKVINDYWLKIKDKNILEEFNKIIGECFIEVVAGIGFNFIRIIDKNRDGTEYEVKFLKRYSFNDTYDNYETAIKEHCPEIISGIIIYNILIPVLPQAGGSIPKGWYHPKVWIPTFRIL